MKLLTCHKPWKKAPTSSPEVWGLFCVNGNNDDEGQTKTKTETSSPSHAERSIQALLCHWPSTFKRWLRAYPHVWSHYYSFHGLRNNRQGSIWPCKSQTDQRWNHKPRYNFFFFLKPHLPLSKRPLFFCLHGLQWWLELSSWSLKTRSPWKRASDMVGFSSLGVLFLHQDLLPFIIYHFWRTCPHTTQSREEEQRPG